MEIKPKYNRWIERESKKGYDKKDLIPTVTFFDEHNIRFEKKDIYKWDGKELENYIKDNLEKLVLKRKSHRGKYNKVFEGSKDGGIKYETDRFLIVEILDSESARFWGVGTKWCITMDGANYFNEYRNNGCAFYFLIDKSIKTDSDKKPPADSKFAIVFYRNKHYRVTKIEFYDACDNIRAPKSLPKHVYNFLYDNDYELIKSHASIITDANSLIEDVQSEIDCELNNSNDKNQKKIFKAIQKNFQKYLNTFYQKSEQIKRPIEHHKQKTKTK